MNYTKITEDAFNELQLNAGVLLRAFDPANPAPPADADIIATTSGGIKAVCNPSYSDFGEDVDNVPNNMMEFKHLDGWDCYMGFTSIKFNAENIMLSIGAADSDGATYAASSDTTVKSGKTYYTRSGTSPNYVYTPVDSPTGNPSTSNYYEQTSPDNHIVPRATLQQSDFMSEIWWVGDKTDGGAVAVKLSNALSTGGFNLQTTKNAKGTMAMTITGHVSVQEQEKVPMEFYVLGAAS